MAQQNNHGIPVITIDNDGVSYSAVDLSAIEGSSSLPYSLRILLENVARNSPGHISRVLGYRMNPGEDVPFYPARVLMQDFTGVPCVVDLAAMRDAMEEDGGDPEKINPVIPVDLVVDHSVQIDYWGEKGALSANVKAEYERNAERYRLLKWAAGSMKGFRVIPPNSGICHQINLEYLGTVARTKVEGGNAAVFPDSLVGTDSHTTMINGLGIMGWGVGGIEAEAVVLGQPYVMPVPEVVGVRLEGELPRGVTASDLVLTLTQILRKRGVVGAFVEYFGPGIKGLPLPDRATIANMSPEYGATMGYFPVDETTIAYLRDTGRSADADLAEAYFKAAGLFYSDETEPEYSEVLVVDLGSVKPSVAGPFRPQDRIDLEHLAESFTADLEKTVPGETEKMFAVEINGRKETLSHGAVAIAAITSCTNTSNPYVMIGAGLLAKKAAALGIRPPAWVKTSLAPGSRVVTDYLERAGVMDALEQLGFGVTAFGCTTCIGNSGPLPEAVSAAARERGLIAASVSSGNRNFEARIHQNVRFNYLMNPMYVVAFALAGTVNLDLQTGVLCRTPDGKDVYLKDIWPGRDEIAAEVKKAVSGDDFEKRYAAVSGGDEYWNSLEVPRGGRFVWDEDSSYIRKPDFFTPDTAAESGPRIKGARILGLFGDSITTDHISPAGTIPGDYPAGTYLKSKGVTAKDFNSYGSRRGNHEVMMRGTFGNIRLKNLLADGTTGGYTKKFPEGDIRFIYDAACAYQEEGTPLVILAGKEYGTGSSRDWAAKGTRMLGVRAVIAESFERIHRSNLAGMGILPFVFEEGKNAASIGLKGDETLDLVSIEGLIPGARAQFTATRPDGKSLGFAAVLRIFSETEAEYLRRGGVLPYVLEKMK